MKTEMKKIVVENDVLRIVVLPELGGKMISLLYKPLNKELLWKTPDREFQIPEYGADFEDYDISGFDECFPTISECKYPTEPWEGKTVPDHGELWGQNHEYRLEDNQIYLKAKGVEFPYTFEKSIRLVGNKIMMEYCVTNLSDLHWQILWSAHPLFNIGEGVSIKLPENAEIIIYGDNRNKLKPMKYPCSCIIDKNGDKTDLSRILPGVEPKSLKVFTTPLEQGWVEMAYPGGGPTLKVSFPEKIIPYLGIWINQGGYPSKKSGDWNLALEPTSSPCDGLDEAIEQKCAMELEPHGTISWNMIIETKKQ